MAKKELKTEVKRLRLTELEAKQLEKYLDDRDLNFSEFVNSLISQQIMSEIPTVLAEHAQSMIQPIPQKKRQSITSRPSFA
ncbi:plasmid mobilization relaxosome protein MobC, partial [Acinetobacter baumannii]|nr:plasmid mobilization relaxosome protein MobC [Acinetobacter baumannii]